jgi:single-strand DNA-binding protein
MFNAFGLGRFVAKPELTTTAKGTNLTKFTLAFNERVKVKEEVVERSHFFDFEAWDKGAETICKYFDKGDVIVLNSVTPRQDKWEDKETGAKRSRVIFRLNEFSFLPSNPRRNKEEQVAENSEKKEDGQPF